MQEAPFSGKLFPSMGNLTLILLVFFIAMTLRAAGVIKSHHTARLTDFVVWISLPCLTVSILSQLTFTSSHYEVAITAWGVICSGALLAWAAGRWLNLQGKTLRSFILISAFPNTGFLGYPVSYALFGAHGLTYAVVFDQIGMFPLFLTLGFLVAGGQESLRTVLRFPPFIALIIGLFLNILGLQPLPYLAVILTTIGWTTLPVTIFLIGAKVKLRSGAPLRTVSIALSLRMVLVPIILSGIYLLHGTFGLSHRVSLLESAMPPALSTSILAMHHQLDEELTISAIGLGTILFIILAFLASLLP